MGCLNFKTRMILPTSELVPSMLHLTHASSQLGQSIFHFSWLVWSYIASSFFFSRDTPLENEHLFVPSANLLEACHFIQNGHLRRLQKWELLKSMQQQHNNFGPAPPHFNGFSIYDVFIMMKEIPTTNTIMEGWMASFWRFIYNPFK